MAGRGETATDGLLEREHECDELARARALAGTGAGDGAVVALEGEAGIGKSALLAHATRSAAESGMRVLTARGGELEQDFGYGVVRQLFDVTLSAMTAGERAQVLSGAAAHASPALSVSAGPAEGAGVTESGAVLHGLYWLTANLAAERALVIAVDDAHWADSASLAFLDYLARRVEGLALLVLYASRVGEGASAQLPAFADAAFTGSVLRPGVLSERGRSSSSSARWVPPAAGSSPGRAGWRPPATRSCFRSCCARCRPTGSGRRGRAASASPRSPPARSAARSSPDCGASATPRRSWHLRSPCSAAAPSCATPRRSRALTHTARAAPPMR